MDLPTDEGAHRAQHDTRDRLLAGVVCKIVATFFFSLMFASVRWIGPHIPIGEMVFFRSFFGLFVIATAALAAGGPALLTTRRIESHAVRAIAGTVAMFCNFAGYIYLPLADATAIGFAAPLFVVILAVMMLSERVHAYRWSAIIIGFLGVLVIARPQAGMAPGALTGATSALTGAFLAALAMIFVRRMSGSEHPATIAFYFMLTSGVISLFTTAFGWAIPTSNEAIILVLVGIAGGAGQLFLSFSYRYGEASVLAPFDYTAMIWAVALGYFLFGELPTAPVWIGSAIVIGAGLLIIWREHRLGRDRALSPPVL